MPSRSNHNKDPLVHEIDVEKGMDKFSKVMDQFEENNIGQRRVLSAWSNVRSEKAHKKQFNEIIISNFSTDQE